MVSEKKCFFPFWLFLEFPNIKYREKRKAMLFNKYSFKSFNNVSYGLLIYTTAHGIMCHLIEYPIQSQIQLKHIYIHTVTAGNLLNRGFIIHSNIMSSK